MLDIASDRYKAILTRKCMRDAQKEDLAEQRLGSYSKTDEGLNDMSSMGWLYRRIRCIAYMRMQSVFPGS